MTMTMTTLLGFAAAALTTLAFVPQVVRSWRTRVTRDVSLGMFLVMTTGIALWLAYGALIGDWPLIVANGIGFLLSLTVLVLKIRHG
jgi:MtN3 and saliva related transmembrane protein